MRFLRVALPALMFYAVAASGVSGRQVDPTLFRDFREWLELARQHVPGQVDRCVRLIREYPLQKLAAVKEDLEAFTFLLRNPTLGRRAEGQKRYTDVEQIELRRMADAEKRAKSDARLMRQIAMLHTDAATLEGAVRYLPAEVGTKPDVVIAMDGLAMGPAVTPPHLAIARTALGGLLPEPAADTWARLWYAAVSSWLFVDANLSGLSAHLKDWRSWIPDDPRLVFAEGCLQELYSTNRLQLAARAARLNRQQVNIPDLQDALTHARDAFLHLRPVDSDYLEARVRLARVQWRLGEARTASDEIQARLGSLSGDRVLDYLANLIAGAVRWTLGEGALSISAYERAFALYPAAQSPAVGLLLVLPPDSTRADAAILAALREPRGSDPWLDYDLGPGRKATSMMSAVRQSPEVR